MLCMDLLDLKKKFCSWNAVSYCCAEEALQSYKEEWEEWDTSPILPFYLKCQVAKPPNSNFAQWTQRWPLTCHTRGNKTYSNSSVFNIRFLSTYCGFIGRNLHPAQWSLKQNGRQTKRAEKWWYWPWTLLWKYSSLGWMSGTESLSSSPVFHFDILNWFGSLEVVFVLVLTDALMLITFKNFINVNSFHFSSIKFYYIQTQTVI